MKIQTIHTNTMGEVVNPSSATGIRVEDDHGNALEVRGTSGKHSLVRVGERYMTLEYVVDTLQKAWLTQCGVKPEAVVEASCLCTDGLCKGCSELIAAINALTAAQQQGQAVAWTEARLRDEAKRRGWYVREGTSVPTVDGDWRHPFSVTAESRDLLELLNSHPMQQGGGEVIQRHVVTKYRDGSVHVADVAAPPSAPVGLVEAATNALDWIAAGPEGKRARDALRRALARAALDSQP